MWSVPYNRQLWRTWVAVGLSSHTNLPTYKEMYENEQDPRFVRKKAGHRFEFSDGKFAVIADMDGDATFKPILRVSLTSWSEEARIKVGFMLALIFRLALFLLTMPCWEPTSEKGSV